MRRRRSPDDEIRAWRDPGGGYELRQASAEAWADALWDRMARMPSDVEYRRLVGLQRDFNQRRPGYPFDPYALGGFVRNGATWKKSR